MGTIYFVSCRKCMITRDLDKFYSATECKTRKEVIELSECFGDLNSGDSFNAALLVSFLAEHEGHDCVFFSEHVNEHLQPGCAECVVEADVDFWGDDEN